MSRRDIACYLGLKVETISRIMTRLDHRQIIVVAGKDIKLNNPDGLLRIIGDLGHRPVRPADITLEKPLAH